MRFFEVKRDELPALTWSACWFFCVLAAYYTIRPVRETFASGLDRDEKANLFAMTLLVMLVATPVYGWVVSRVGKRRLVPVVYGFFIVNLIGFWVLLGGEPSGEWVPKAFFVWIGVFNLFVVTLFWGTIVDLFDGQQGNRLFGLIFAVGTLGQLASSWGVQLTSETLGVRNLLVVSALLLVTAIVCSWNLRLQKKKGSAAETNNAYSSEVTWSTIWQGVVVVVKSPYLLGIAGFILTMSICATMVYFQMTEMVGDQFESDEQRTSWFATVNAVQAVVTLLMQTAVVGWLLGAISVGLTLAMVPVVFMIGFGALAIWPTLFVIGAFQVALRSGSFSLASPSLEVLFTAVASEQKYRAKAFIDTVGKRTGDVLGAQGCVLFGWLGMAATTVSLAMLPIVVIAFVLSLILGSAYKQATAITQIDRTDQR